MGLPGEEYVELVRDAKDALGALLRASEPGTGAGLHKSYTVLKSMLERKAPAYGESEEREAERQAQLERWRVENERREARSWKRVPMHIRERQVLEALGERQLTIAEVTEALEEAHGTDLDIYRPNVSSMLKRLKEAREVDRVAEQWKGRKRYHYFRRTQLDGPIADLQRSLEEEGDR